MTTQQLVKSAVDKTMKQIKLDIFEAFVSKLTNDKTLVESIVAGSALIENNATAQEETQSLREKYNTPEKSLELAKKVVAGDNRARMELINLVQGIVYKSLSGQKLDKGSQQDVLQEIFTWLIDNNPRGAEKKKWEDGSTLPNKSHLRHKTVTERVKDENGKEVLKEFYISKEKQPDGTFKEVKTPVPDTSKAQEYSESNNPNIGTIEPGNFRKDKKYIIQSYIDAVEKKLANEEPAPTLGQYLFKAIETKVYPFINNLKSEIANEPRSVGWQQNKQYSADDKVKYHGNIYQLNSRYRETDDEGKQIGKISAEDNIDAPGTSDVWDLIHMGSESVDTPDYKRELTDDEELADQVLDKGRAFEFFKTLANNEKFLDSLVNSDNAAGSKSRTTEHYSKLVKMLTENGLETPSYDDWAKVIFPVDYPTDKQWSVIVNRVKRRMKAAYKQELVDKKDRIRQDIIKMSPDKRSKLSTDSVFDEEDELSKQIDQIPDELSDTDKEELAKSEEEIAAEKAEAEQKNRLSMREQMVDRLVSGTKDGDKVPAYFDESSINELVAQIRNGKYDEMMGLSPVEVENTHSKPTPNKTVRREMKDKLKQLDNTPKQRRRRRR